MGSTEIRISAKELDRLSVTCKCGGALVFPANDNRMPGSFSCPNCSVRLERIVDLITSYREFFRAATPSSADFEVSFIIKADD